MEFEFGGGNRDAGLAFVGLIPTITMNSAIWAKRNGIGFWRLEVVDGRVTRTTDVAALHNDGIEDIWIRVGGLPAGWYEIEAEPLTGLTRSARTYVEIRRYGDGVSFISRILSNRKRLELIMIRGWY